MTGSSLYCALRENASHAQVRTLLDNEFATNVSKGTSLPHVAQTTVVIGQQVDHEVRIDPDKKCTNYQLASSCLCCQIGVQTRRLLPAAPSETRRQLVH